MVLICFTNEFLFLLKYLGHLSLLKENIRIKRCEKITFFDSKFLFSNIIWIVELFGQTKRSK